MSEPLQLADKLDAATLLELYRALRRRVGLALAIFVLGLGLTLASLPPRVEKYSSTAVVRVLPDELSLQYGFQNLGQLMEWLNVIAQGVAPGGEPKLPDGYHLVSLDEDLQMTVTDPSAGAARQKAAAWAEALCQQINQIRRTRTPTAELRKKYQAKCEEVAKFDQQHGHAAWSPADLEHQPERQSLMIERDALGKTLEQAIADENGFANAGKTLAQIEVQPVEGCTPSEISKPTRLLILGLAASVFFALVVPIALELLNCTVTPHLLPREFPSVAIPLSPTPSSLSGDALHALYVSMQLELRKLGPGQARVVAITGAERGAGSTMLCGQLAGIAKSLGEKVLATECNSLAPAEAAGKLDLASAQKAADALRREYKLILIDTPPVAASGNARAIVDAADLTMLVVASRRTRFSALNQALETLRRGAAPRLLLVLNRVDAFDRRTYFGAEA